MRGMASNSNKSSGAFKNVLNDGSSIVIIFICELLDGTKNQFILKNKNISENISKYDIKIYQRLYNWIYDNISLFDLLNKIQQIFECAFLFDLIQMILKNVSSIFVFDEFIADIFDLNEFGDKIPCLHAFFKLNFINEYFKLKVDARIDFVNFAHAQLEAALKYGSQMKELGAINFNDTPFINICEISKSWIKFNQNRRLNLINNNFDNNVKNIDLNNSINVLAHTDFVNDKLARLNLNNYIDNSDHIINFILNNKKCSSYTIYTSLLAMDQAHLFADSGLAEESRTKILSFLYNSFKTKQDKLICLSQAISIHSLLKNEIPDANLPRLVSDLIKKSQAGNHYKFLIYSQLVKLVKFDSINTITALDSLIDFKISNIYDYLHISLIRAHIFSNAGFNNISEMIINKLHDNFFIDANIVEKYPLLYQSFICIKAFVLFKKNEVEESVKLMRNYISMHSSDIKTLNCYYRIRLFSKILDIDIPDSSFDYEYFNSPQVVFYSQIFKFINNGDFYSAAEVLSSHLRSIDLDSGDYNELIDYIVSKEFLSFVYFNSSQFYDAFKNACELAEICFRKRLMEVCANSIFMAAKCLIQLYLIDKAFPFLDILHRRFANFLSPLLKTELNQFLIFYQDCFTEKLFNIDKNIVINKCASFDEEKSLFKHLEDCEKLFNIF